MTTPTPAPAPQKRTQPPVDIARMLPPAMRAAAHGSKFAFARMAIWGLFVALFCVTLSHRTPTAPPSGTFSQRASYDGHDAKFLVGLTGTAAAMFVDGTLRPFETNGSATAIDDGTGKKWSAELDEKGRLVISHPDHMGFTVRGHGENEWLVLGAAGGKLYKVKIKDGNKIGVYDADGKRIARGKRKSSDKIHIYDDGETELATIDSSEDLASIVWLAVPVPIEVRAILTSAYSSIAQGEAEPGDAPDADEKQP